MKIITTVGTSIFSNCKRLKGTEIDSDYNTLEKKSYDEWDGITTQTTIKRLKGKIDTWAEGKPTASAEIASIIKIKVELEKQGFKEVEVHLLCTETILSRLAAECIQNYFTPSVVKSIHVVEGLKLTTFEQSGFDSLVLKLDKLTGIDTIYNISGGYKALTTVLTLFAQVYSIETKYLYEDSNVLITIGKLPFDFNWEIIESNYSAFESLEKNEQNLPNKLDFTSLLTSGIDEIIDLIEFFDFNGTDKVRRSVLGRILWTKYKRLFESGEFHRQNLLSNLIEYKVYEHYIDKFENCKVKTGIMPHGFDIDTFVLTNKFVIFGEVKPAGNVPVRGKDSIEKKLTDGGFRALINSNVYSENKAFIFQLLVYGAIDVHPIVLQKVKKLFEDKLDSFPKNVSLEMWHIKVPPNYKANVNWKIQQLNKILEIKHS